MGFSNRWGIFRYGSIFPVVICANKNDAEILSGSGLITGASVATWPVNDGTFDGDQSAITGVDGIISFTAETLTITSEVGTDPAPISLTLSNVGGKSADWNLSTFPRAKWLKITPDTGTLKPTENQVVTISIDSKGKDVGQDTTTITEAWSQSTIAITYTRTAKGSGTGPVNPPPTQPGQLQANVAALNFLAGSPTDKLADQTVVLKNVGGQDLTWSLASNVGWLGFSLSKGTLKPNETVNVPVTINNLPAVGTTKAEIGFYPTPGKSFVIPVTVVVAAGSKVVGPQMMVNVSSMAFSSLGNAVPATQQFAIGNSGDQAATWTITSSATWLSVDKAKGSTDPNKDVVITVSIDPTKAANDGENKAQLVIMPNVGKAQTVNVILLRLKTPALAPGLLQTSVSSMAFLAQSLVNPPAQTLTIRNVGGQALTWTATKDLLATWLSLDKTTGTLKPGESADIKVTVSSTIPATSNANLTITPSVGKPVVVPVTFTVTFTPPPPKPKRAVMNTSSTYLDMRRISRSNHDDDQQAYTQLTIRNDGDADLKWNLEETPSNSWFKVNKYQGTLTPGQSDTVTFSVDMNWAIGYGVNGPYGWHTNKYNLKGSDGQNIQVQINLDYEYS